MPLTEKGRKIMSAMQETYGKERGERIFHASKAAGKITGVDKRRRVRRSVLGGTHG